MQTASRNYLAVNDMLSRKDYETAKAQLTKAREQLAITITFWRDNKRDDAVRLLRDTLAKTDSLDNVLSEENVDPAAVEAASRELNVSCQACHAVYRDQDPVSKAYRIKLGSSR
jgi:hypothetical protein